MGHVMETEELRSAVYGEDYDAAKSSMLLLQQEITQHENVGFGSLQELEAWAHENLLDNVVFSSSQHRFYNVSHKGELITPQTFEEYYKDILFFYATQANGSMKPIRWVPKGYKYFNNAKLPGEISDGTHAPLFYRDYSRPTGYYNQARGAYNCAKPFPVFAKETGRDTSYIYTYIHAIAGVCAPWLLLWLKTKMLYPTQKTQVVPIIVSRTQGTGKSTFGEVICKGLFGQDNVLVTDQYDATARFNSDYADALVVCQEEKEETDRKNPVATLKSRATATMIRKELKGIDPIYQESYTEFVITTNKDVPVKFDSPDDQRRFMVMEADGSFTSQNAQAKEIFEKLYGYSSTGEKTGVPFVDDHDLIEQFKHELYQWDETVNGEKISLRKFPHTAAYQRCYAIPRTTEDVEIESIIRSLIPFIKTSLLQKADVTSLPDIGELSNIVQYQGALEYFPSVQGQKDFVALCRPLVFYDMQSNKAYSHAVVEKSLLNAVPLFTEAGIMLMSDTRPVPGGFTKIQGRYKDSVTARFCLLDDTDPNKPKRNDDTQEFSGMINLQIKHEVDKDGRIGQRLRVNNVFYPDFDGCFETVNEMKPGTTSLKGNKTQNVQYMDTFLLESDDCSDRQYKIEKERAANCPDDTIESTVLYKERLDVQKAEAERLFNEGTVCRIVYSGAKSYHMLVRVDIAPETVEEYKWLHAYLCTSLSDKVSFDPTTSDPARLTRSPVTLDRLTSNYDKKVHGIQRLIDENFKHVYHIDWKPLYEQWLNRPLKSYEKKGRKLLPTKQIYKEAVEALLDHTYWTAAKFDGQRQETFFPAYRLLRSLGYSHEELWANNILSGIESYAKPNEITYWRTRENCNLIQQIDFEMEEMDNGREAEAGDTVCPGEQTD